MMCLIEAWLMPSLMVGIGNTVPDTDAASSFSTGRRHLLEAVGELDLAHNGEADLPRDSCCEIQGCLKNATCNTPVGQQERPPLPPTSPGRGRFSVTRSTVATTVQTSPRGACSME